MYGTRFSPNTPTGKNLEGMGCSCEAISEQIHHITTKTLVAFADFTTLPPCSFLAVIETGYVPFVFGVPEITPVVLEYFKPGGRFLIVKFLAIKLARTV
jgi:hypothetical protein